MGVACHVYHVGSSQIVFHLVAREGGSTHLDLGNCINTTSEQPDLYVRTHTGRACDEDLPPVKVKTGGRIGRTSPCESV